jgi:hypothetical protein
VAVEVAVVSMSLAACGQGRGELAAPAGPIPEVAQETTTTAALPPTIAVPPVTTSTTAALPPGSTTSTTRRSRPPGSTTSSTTQPARTTTTARTQPAPAPGTATTVAPTTTTADPGDEDEEDAGQGIDWGLVGLIAAIALAVALLIVLVASQVRRRGREQQVLGRRLAHIVDGSQWVHDEASLELMSGAQSPERLRSGWNDVRRRINDLSVETAEAALGADEATATALGRLGSALGQIEGAIDTYVELRLQSTGDAGSLTAIDESVATVNERRHELRAAIAPLAARV